MKTFLNTVIADKTWVPRQLAGTGSCSITNCHPVLALNSLSPYCLFIWCIAAMLRRPAPPLTTSPHPSLSHTTFYNLIRRDLTMYYITRSVACHTSLIVTLFWLSERLVHNVGLPSPPTIRIGYSFI
ncbi:hypothetical protein J6590_017336 [Homalodisca vitripennis]|nr:hypothetical protein J6590_017336 [Homalodisca vitripennis]